MRQVKGILCVFLLALLQSMTAAQAYEADIHYSTTYVLARAVGWTGGEALTIASANQGVDENQDTVAALEVDSLSNSLHQAEKNLRFHCFGETHGQAGGVSADVLEVISNHFAEVRGRDETPGRKTARLIALGTALHCQQDAHAHADFGGSCGSHPGSCYGHTYETFLDQVVFRILKKHYFHPDHPGVSGQRLPEALRQTASKLAFHRPKTSSRSISTHELGALSGALRESGLELPDEVRRDCNRYVAGKWLFDFFHSGRSSQGSSDKVETLGSDVAVTCRNASLASATVVSIPGPRFPRLNADASPYLVRADGRYQLAGNGDFDAAPKARVQWSHWRQIFASPLTVQVAQLSAGNSAR